MWHDDVCDGIFKTEHLSGYWDEGKHEYLEIFMYCSEVGYSRLHLFLKTM